MIDPIGLLVFIAIFALIFWVISRFLPDPFKIIALVVVGIIFFIGLLQSLGAYHGPWIYHY